MKVKIGGLELSEISLEELDELVRRYGNQANGGDSAESGSPAQPSKTSTGGAPINGATADTVVLQKLVEAGNGGVLSTDLGTILGKRGKATRGAVRDWAKRVGVSSDDDPIEDCRTNGNGRGIRLKAALVDVAKAILSEKKK